MRLVSGTNLNDSITIFDAIPGYTVAGSSGGNGTFSDDILTVNGLNGNDTIDLSSLTSLSGISFQSITVNGDNNDDTIIGSAFNDNLRGDSGLTSGLGNDTIWGGLGDDTITGGLGADTMDGEEGSDFYQIINEANGDTFNDTGTAGIDTVKNVGGPLTLSSIGTVGSGASTQVGGIEIFDGMGQVVQGDNLNNLLDFTYFGTVTGVPMVNGFNGNDTINVSNFDAAVTVNGGNNNDTITGTDFSDTLNGDFSAISGAGNDTIFGGLGDDTITGGVGADTMDGEEGSDSYLVHTQADGDTFDDTGASGTDIVKNIGGTLLLRTLGDTSSTANTKVDGIELLDVQGQAIHGDNFNNILDFTVFGNVTGAPTVDGFNGNDTINVSNFDAAVTVNGGNNNDTITGTDFSDTLNGDFSAISGAGNDTIFGGLGDDTITGGVGADTMDGEEGSDSYLVHTQADGDTFDDTGASGTDIVKNIGGTLLLRTLGDTSSTANTKVDGIELLDVQGQAIHGDNFNNILDFTVFGNVTGAPTVDGFNGNDTINVSNFDAAVTVNGGNNNDTIIGTDFSDTLNGDFSAISGVGNDTIFGGLGDDTITGGVGADTMDGQEGSDIYLFANEVNGDTYHDTGISGTDILRNIGGKIILTSFGPGGSGTGATYSGIEVFDVSNESIQGDNLNNTIDLSDFELTVDLISVNGFNGNDVINVSTANAGVVVNGGNNDDTITGSKFGDRLNGDFSAISGIGNDTIYGGSGNDTIVGGFGNDILKGQSGRDNIQGNAGNDILIGGRSRDTLSGGTGSDDFVLTSIRDGGDIITDFEVGTDKIVLTKVLDQFDYNGSDPIADGYLGFRSRGADTIVTFDTDGSAGSGRARSFLLLRGVTAVELNNADNFTF